MNIQERILTFVTRTNWVLFVLTSAAGFMLASRPFACGILCGGLIVTVNFHLLHRTLQKALRPPRLASHQTVLAKYYLRFLASAVVLFFLIANHWVDPPGLFIGLSVVVASIMLATARELKRLIFKEAV